MSQGKTLPALNESVVLLLYRKPLLNSTMLGKCLYVPYLPFQENVTER